MKQTISFLTLLLWITLTQAQVDTISHYEIARHDGTLHEMTILVDAPDDLPNLLFGAGINLGTRPLNAFDYHLTTFAEYQIKNFGFVAAKVDIPVIPMMDQQYSSFVNYTQLQTTSDFFIYDAVDVTLGYNFLDTTLFAFEKVTIKLKQSKDHHRYNDRVYFHYDTRYKFAGRLGLFHYQSMINNNYLSDTTLADVNGKLIGVAGKGSISQLNNEHIYHTNFRVNSLYVGIDSRLVRNLYVQLNEDTIRNSKGFRLYGDIFIAPFIKIHDMEVRNFNTGAIENYQVSHRNGNGLEKRMFGYRIGAEWIDFINEHASFNLRMEYGVRPGIKNTKNEQTLIGNKQYLQFTVAYLWGTKLEKTPQ